MLQGWFIVAVALGYIGLLFLIASYGDRTRSRRRESMQATLDLQASDYEIFRAIAEDILRRNQEDKDRTRLLLFSGLERSARRQSAVSFCIR